MRLQIGAFAIAIVLLAGCSTYPVTGSPKWTDETLFANAVSTYTRPPGALSGYSSINGDDLAAITKGIDFLKASGDRWCGNLRVQDHYVFFKRKGTILWITIVPAYVPDPDNVSGVYTKEGGTQQVVVAPIDGARQLLGCSATIETHDDGLSFVRKDSNAR